jgi:putative membrane protein
MMKAEHFFPDAAKERLEAAIHEAERKTSGEIVPYIVGRSDAYAEAPWRAGTLVAMLVLFLFSILDRTSPAWTKYGITEAGLFTVAGFLFGASLVLLFPALTRLVVHHHTIDLRVNERARLAFLDGKIFQTRERTGVLIFLSLLEKRVVVLGDEGINAKVKQAEWDAIVKTIVDGIKSKRPSEGLLRAIEACGTLLEAEHLTKRPDDTNELSDTIQIHES